MEKSGRSLGVIVFDFGGSHIRIGRSDEKRPSLSIPSAIGKKKKGTASTSTSTSPSVSSSSVSAKGVAGQRILWGSDLDATKDVVSLALKRPHERGYVVNPKLLCDILRRVMFRSTGKRAASSFLDEHSLELGLDQLDTEHQDHRESVSAATTNMFMITDEKRAIATIPPFAPEVCMAYIREILEEEFGFEDVRFACPPSLSWWKYRHDRVRQIRSWTDLGMEDTDSEGRHVGKPTHSPPQTGKGVVMKMKTLEEEDMSTLLMRQVGFDALPKELGPIECLCGVVVDSGFSVTFSVPFFGDRMISSGIRRLDIGGKFLTNHLKELVSFRCFNLMDDFLIANHMKEVCSFMRPFPPYDRKGCRMFDEEVGKSFGKYVLPKGNESFEDRFGTYQVIEGKKKLSKRPISAHEEGGGGDDEEQTIVLANERYMVPEALMDPEGVIGMKEEGIAGCIVQSILACPLEIRPLLTQNILLTGGNMRIKNILERIGREVRASLPDAFDVHVHLANEPDAYAWQGAAEYSRDILDRSNGDENVFFEAL
eukprot:TRINITY_DN36612_c0_g1_i1.p1 TRINITY_DN36612_c0_g1~~TRINITY_DN36612_c0_g1_i1.p1  ORF type:complete len:539 (-),score=151.13 TRINITY_DN36612_c0_g1_i1:23-1639(-)